MSRPAVIHHAVWVAGVTLVGLVAASAFRSSTGALMQPIEDEFGWSRTTTSGAVSLNLALYGLIAPFAAAVMESWGVRRTVTVSLLVVAVATALTTVMTSPWQLWLLWGLGVGTGTGAMALTFGAIVANRWFARQRGLVMGIFSAASATGQLVFLPVIARTIAVDGWRQATLVVAGLSVVAAVLIITVLRDRPSDLGLEAWGARGGEGPVEPASTTSPARLAMRVLAMGARRWPFWALMIGFFICGWTTNGLVQTHFINAAHDHGMPATTAAGLLAVVGIFDIVGTIASGWLTDRVDPRVLLAVYYGLRGLSLLFVHQTLAATVEFPLWAFIIFYGLDWVATVPPTVALCRAHFGVQYSGVAFGWVYASHMVGAAAGASVAGWVRSSQGSYQLAWWVAAGLCLVAAAVSVAIPRRAAVALAS